MKVRLFRRLVNDRGGFDRRGDVVDVGQARGAQLIRRQLAEEVQPGKKDRKASTITKEAAAATLTETRPSGSPTGQAITSSSLVADRPRRGRPRKKQEAAPE